MRDLSQWLCWRTEERDGKPTKVPYSPLTGQRASSTTPETWAGYQEAVRTCKEHGYDGIGFVFTPEDDLCGVDLDRCLDPQTGEMEPWAQEIVEELNSYTEISPSGTGVHVLVRAKLPRGRNRKGRFEAYDRGRYFTVTDRHLPGTPQGIEGRQEELQRVARRVFGEPNANGHGPPVTAPERANNGLSDDEVVRKALAASNGERVARLWVGDTAEYGSHSEADLALVSLFAFYTRDPEQLDRLFRRSALYRTEKWGKRADYRRRTIGRALDGLTETYPASSSSSSHRGGGGDDARAPLAVKSFRDLPKPDGPRPFRVEGLVPERFVTTIYGSGGSAKSLIALSMAQGCARGDGSWLGHKLKPCPALYVDWELDEEEQGRRARQLARANGDDQPPENLYYLCAAGRRRSEVLAATLAACEEHRIGLVVLDSAGLAIEGDPSDARVAIEFFRELDRFRSRGVTVLLVDHQAKAGAGESYQGKTAYGSVYKGNLSRSRLQVEAKDRKLGGLSVVVRHNKANFSGLSDPFKVKLSFSEEMVALAREELAEEELAEERTLNASERILLTLQGGPAFPDDLVAPTGVVIGTVKNILTGLKRRKLVKTTGDLRGKAQEVRLTDEGERHVRDYLNGCRAPSSPSPERRSGDGDDDE